MPEYTAMSTDGVDYVHDVCVVIKGRSTYTKPTEFIPGTGQPIPNDAMLIDLDTGNMFYFDAATKTWLPFGG